jgi:acyltransferase
MTISAAESQKHIEWVDTAKGLGLFLVVYGHMLYSGTWGSLNQAIYSFHMPMYLILSGFISHEVKISFWKYFNSLFFRLIVPSIFFILLTVPFLLQNDKLSLIEILKKISFLNGRVPHNAPVWFFIVMFQVLLIYHLIKAPKYNIFFRFLLASISFVLGYVVFKFKIPMIFGFEKTLVALGFFSLGSVIADISRRCSFETIVWTVILMLPVWIVSGCILNPKVSMYTFSLKKYWFFIISGIAGSICWFAFSWLFRKSAIARLWGQNSIFIIGTHYFLITWYRTFAGKTGFARTSVFNFSSIFVAVALLFLYIPVCKFIDRYVPVISGKSFKIKK